MIRVELRQVARKDGLSRAPQVLRKHLRSGLEGLGKRLEASARTRMRSDTGRGQRSLQTRVTGEGLNLRLEVTSQLVQVFVDAYGLKRGVFPNFAVNSKLFGWALRRVKNVPNKRVPHLGPVPSGRARKKIKRISRVQHIAAPAIGSRRLASRNLATKRLTFLVARAIFRKGIAATHWNKKTLEANKGRIIRDISNALSRGVNELKRTV